ncbi:thioredoxin family protein [Candidatus Daviesbacteria bacterium]|nr:thioredoxin family protein [Candidatus Daviesbacteria bacterium]
MERKLLDFYADWCGPCTGMKPIIEKLKQEVLEPNGIIYEEINIDPDNNHHFVESIKQQFDIIGVPTFITMEDGQEIDRRHGGYLKEIKAFIKNSFPDIQI